MTDTEVFHGASGDRNVPMMHMDSKMSFYQTEQFQAVALRLNENGTMYFILPEEGIDVEKIVTATDTIQLIRNPGEAEESHPLVHLSVPKFKVSEKISLLEHLEMLGITDAMNRETADFTPLTDEVKKLWLSDAEHAAVLEIDEEGVTGAAYTELMVVAAGMSQIREEVDFVLDRPFCFAVTGGDDSILFAGIVRSIE